MSGPRQLSIHGERFERWVNGFAERHGPVDAELDPVTGDSLALVAEDGATATCVVPFAPLANPEGQAVGVIVECLATHVLTDRRLAVVLLRRGGYAVGVFQGRDLLDSKVGTRYVQGRTAAGGQSQQRFARRRGNQADALVGAAADVAHRVLDSHSARLEGIVLGGDRALLATLLEDSRLATVAALPRGPFLTVPDPRQRVLLATPARYRSVHVSLLEPSP